jgi:hypothetical protein
MKEKTDQVSHYEATLVTSQFLSLYIFRVVAHIRPADVMCCEKKSEI